MNASATPRHDILTGMIDLLEQEYAALRRADAAAVARIGDAKRKLTETLAGLDWPTPPGAELAALLARCNDLAGTMSGLFFSEELQDIAKAKEICARCPVIGECLEGALERREPWGVWGGQLLLNGKVLQSKRRRGRPPKVARPEDHFPEIPVPEHLRERVVYKSA